MRCTHVPLPSCEATHIGLSVLAQAEKSIATVGVTVTVMVTCPTAAPDVPVMTIG